MLPLNVDVPMNRLPIVNWVILAAIIASSLLAWFVGGVYQALLGFGFFFLHGDIVHLAGNLVFLWVFGNAVNYKVGHLWFLSIFFGGAYLSWLAFAWTMPGVPAIGASGAIWSVMGAFLVFFPRNDVTISMDDFAILRYEVPSFVMILIWIAFDMVVWYLFGQEETTIAHAAHVAGFIIGFSIGLTLAWLRIIEPTPYEETLLQVVGIHSLDRDGGSDRR